MILSLKISNTLENFLKWHVYINHWNRISFEFFGKGEKKIKRCQQLPVFPGGPGSAGRRHQLMLAAPWQRPAAEEARMPGTPEDMPSQPLDLGPGATGRRGVGRHEGGACVVPSVALRPWQAAG